MSEELIAKLEASQAEVKRLNKELKKAKRLEARLRDSMAQTDMVSRRHAQLMSRAITDLEEENVRRLASEEQARLAKQEAEEAAQAKGDFLANMSHELRTPMNGVLGMIQLSLMSVKDVEVRENLEVAWQSAHDLLSLLNDILDFSKIEARRMTIERVEVDPWSAVDDTIAVLAPLAAKKSIPIYFSGGSQVPAKILTDPVRFRQVVKNLLSNAIKFTQDGYVFIKVSYDRKDEQLWVRVIDTGIGIPQARLETIFDAFTQADTSTTRKYGGTGLGLAIVKELVELLGGTLKVSSKIGKGTVFEFSIHAPKHEFEPRKFGPYRCGLQIRVEPERAVLIEILEYMGLQVVVLDGQSDETELHLVITDGDDTFLDVPQIYIIDHLASAREGRKELRRPIRRANVCAALEKNITDTTIKALTSPKMVVPQERSTATRIVKKILVVDDNPVNRLMTCKMLKRLGYEADTCANGLEAVEQVEETAYPIILMDCQMPVMDGYTATRTIRSMSIPKQPVIVALTADAFAHTRVACLDSGMNDFLTKPISVDRLREGLERAVTVIVEKDT